ncbi:MAG: putative DNA binding domain-containing protein [Oscillospiraceae bacterium]|jgi:ATP-dependent DNA helicase RecG|nr:putative DNA binding domain-containing protein [Oscillospiraceae bacterium]
MASLTFNKNSKLLEILYGLINDWENEVVEFKQVSNDFSQHDVGKYFSAISNEANLKNLHYGWLVFGVENKTKKIMNTDYRNTKGLEKLKHEIADNSTGGITFIDIFEVFEGIERIVMFKIPAAVTGIPTAWKGHYYGREGESLGPLSIEELERIRRQVHREWSNQIIEDARLEHLSNEAIQKARKGYKDRHNNEHIGAETDSMNDEEFLTKLKLMINGKLTNAAMILLGNSDYDNLLDVPVSAMWRLHGLKDRMKDYEEFRIPFILLAENMYTRIRNLKYRYMPDQTTLDTTITLQYNEDLLKELLYNCIAHQDYVQGGRIYVDEFEDEVIISNPGNFIPGDVRKVLKKGYTAPYYRNPLLAEVMMNIKLIDSAQWGILKVYNTQRDRYFPLPDYDFSTPNKVAVTVYGKVLDQNYTKLLFNRSDLDIDTVFLLDRVQKKLPLEREQYQQLRRLGIIEGKVPNVYISLNIAEIVDGRAQYTKNKAMDDQYYRDLIINYLQQFGSGTKADIIKLLSSKFSDVLDEKQKADKARNLLMSMSRKGLVKHVGKNQRTGSWELANDNKKRQQSVNN